MHTDSHTARAAVERLLEAKAAPEDVLQRAARLERHRIEDGVVTVDLVRHPGFQIPGQLADATIAHFVVRQRYVVRDGALELEDELFEGIGGRATCPDSWAEIDAGFYVGEVVLGEIRRLPTLDAVEKWAATESARIATVIEEMSFPPDSARFIEGMEEAGVTVS